ncbi:MAG TPA: BA14K family protein [Pseudolabrys sp.]|nr:BA14K family protein [Pseudolabrys sp.]
MSFILYVVVLVVSVSSVMMGLDWLSSPPPTLPKSVQTASAPSKPAAPVMAKNATAHAAVKKPASGEKTASAKQDSKPAAQEQAAATASPAVAGKADTAKAPSPESVTATAQQVHPAPETAGSAPAGTDDALAKAPSDGGPTVTDSVAAGAAQAAAPRCDVQACGAHYRSFDPATCTYQPYDGPRRLCTVGAPPIQARAAAVETSDARRPAAPASCNVQACGASYRSFDPATCTYQPYDGPRRLCTK